MTPIKYVGKRTEYTDGAYGTRIVFKQGETKLVPDDVAAKMLRHPDVYERGEGKAKPDVPAPIDPEQKKLEEAERDLQDTRDAVANMDKESLLNFAKANFGQQLAPNMKVENLRAKVVGLIDQYGLP